MTKKTQPKVAERGKLGLITTSAFGQKMNSWRRRVDGNCLYCGNPMRGVLSRKYGSDACRQAAYRLRKLEKKLAALRKKKTRGRKT